MHFSLDQLQVLQRLLSSVVVVIPMARFLPLAYAKVNDQDRQKDAQTRHCEKGSGAYGDESLQYRALVIIYFIFKARRMFIGSWTQKRDFSRRGWAGTLLKSENLHKISASVTKTTCKGFLHDSRNVKTDLARHARGPQIANIQTLRRFKTSIFGHNGSGNFHHVFWSHINLIQKCPKARLEQGTDDERSTAR